jgi:hypothetical protein
MVECRVRKKIVLCGRQQMQTGSMKSIALAMVALLAPTGVVCGHAVAQDLGSRGPEPSRAERAGPTPPPHASPASASVPESPPGDSQATAPASVADDFEGQWKQVVSRFPEAAEYREAQAARVPLQDLLNWAPPGRATTIYDRACRPIRIGRRDDAFHGLVNKQTSVEGNSRNEHADEVLLGARIVVTCGIDKHYRRGWHGQWVNDRTGFTGCVNPVGLRLSKVTSDAAWYNDQVVRLYIACTANLDEEMPCAGGGSRKCTRCLEWGIHATSLEQKYGMGRSVPTVTGKATMPVDCSSPCPSMDLPDGSKDMQDALEGRKFLVEGPEEHPFLFRTRAACMRYWRQHPIPADEQRVW